MIDRDLTGPEVDLVVDDGAVLTLVETKSGATVASDWFRPLLRALEEARTDHPEREVRGAVVYGGDAATQRHGIRVVPWREVGELAPRVAPGA